MMPKLPEPDGYYYPESPSFSKPVPSFWLEASVRAIQEEAYKAGMDAAVPDGLSKIDADFWLANRAKIIAACKEQGFTIVTTAKGVHLMRLGRIEALAEQEVK